MIYHNLKNKVAVVTGGTKGIGKAIVLKLLQLDMKVAITFAHDQNTANTFQAELQEYKNKSK